MTVVKTCCRSVVALLCVWIMLVSVMLYMPLPETAQVAAATGTGVDGGSGIIVSLGDSYSAGEGIPDYYDQDLAEWDKVESQDWLAHRSENSWSSRLTLDGVTMSSSRNNKWYFVAASGATTEDLKGEQKKEYVQWILAGKKYLDPQLDVFDTLKTNNKQAEYVTMTMGGNDADFAGVVMDAVKGSTYQVLNPNFLPDKLNKIWRQFYDEYYDKDNHRQDSIRDQLYNAYKDISNSAGKQAKIIIAGYPWLVDPDAKGPFFTRYTAGLVNDSVTRFNKEINNIVNQCRSEGIKICFVSVEEEFKQHAAYADTPYINSISLATFQELDLLDLTSAGSMHPNSDGAQVYADYVQAKIDQIETYGEESEWPLLSSSDELEVVLVLDTSGSMDGTAMEETVEAARRFVDVTLTEDAAVGIVAYDSDALMISPCCQSQPILLNALDTMNAGGNTNMDAGLEMAYDMLKDSPSKNKLIVLMSDGQPNEGRTGSDLIDFADEIRAAGIRIYTLGFFQGMYSNSSEQSLLQGIADTGCHYEVTKAEDLVLFFGDIADQIQGTKYIYVRIACPVDVTVEYNGEVLSSKDMYESQRTSFGTLTFEDNDTYVSDSTDNRIKILRLKEGAAYNVDINGNGTGVMHYSIGFMNENGEYDDVREFSDISVTPDTKVATVAKNASVSTVQVDNDGDGKYDDILQVTGKGHAAVRPVREETDVRETILWVCVAVAGVSLLFTVLMSVVLTKYRKKRKALAVAETAKAAEIAAAKAVPEFCHGCGQKLEPDERFCPRCGADTVEFSD